jgi:hypothetical protein
MGMGGNFEWVFLAFSPRHPIFTLVTLGLRPDLTKQILSQRQA